MPVLWKHESATAHRLSSALLEREVSRLRSEDAEILASRSNGRVEQQTAKMMPSYVVENIAHLWTVYLTQGLTRKDVASLAQVSERAIRKYEEGTQYPSRKVYNKLAVYLGWELWQ